MRKNYDFSKARRSPYAKRPKAQVGAQMPLYMTGLIRTRFKNSSCFVSGEEVSLPVEFDPGNEQVVGWYLNPPPFERDFVVFTTTAFYYRQADLWVRIAWSNVAEHEHWAQTKTESGLQLMDDAGTSHFVRFAGCRGPPQRSHDAFVFLQLLRTVLRLRDARRRGKQREANENLSPAAKRLAEYMSDLSEKAYYAGWEGGLEIELWAAVVDGPRKYGHLLLTNEHIERLRDLSSAAGGWVVYEHDGMTLVPIEQWRARFDEWKRSRQ